MAGNESRVVPLRNLGQISTHPSGFPQNHPVPQKPRDHILPQPSSTAQQRKENLNEMVESAFRATMGNGNFIPEGSKLFEIPLL